MNNIDKAIARVRKLLGPRWRNYDETLMYFILVDMYDCFDWPELLKAEPIDFIHDILGAYRHYDGFEFKDGWWPRLGTK